MSKQRLEVLLSAMHLKDHTYINTLNIKTDCVVINQCDEEKREDIVDEGRKVAFISTTERGSSRSRNMAIRHATSEICILCDNDVEYVVDYEHIILNAFEAEPDADVIVFYIERKERQRPIFNATKKMGYYSACKAGSPEIAFRRNRVLDIPFKIEFGSGTHYAGGEENIFLFNCLNKRLKVLYVPAKIAQLREEPSTWFHGFDETFFSDRGAIFCEIAGELSFVFILYFAIKKYGLYKKDFSMIAVIRLMLKGKRQYRRKKRGEPI